MCISWTLIPQPPLGPVSSLTDSSVRVRSAAWPGKCHVTKQFKTDKPKCTYQRANPTTLNLFWWRRCLHLQSKVNSNSRQRAMVLVIVKSQESRHLCMCLNSSPVIDFHDHNTITGPPPQWCRWELQSWWMCVTNANSIFTSDVPFIICGCSIFNGRLATESIAFVW